VSSNEIVLKVEGKVFTGWKRVMVEKSLFQITGAFGLATTARFPDSFDKYEFALGDACTVEINGQTIITGYVEDIPISYDSNSHEIQVGGRDKTGDLVDCSFVESPNKWDGQTIGKIIRVLCAPFDIDIVIDDSVAAETNTKTADNTFKVNEGETIFDSILRLCKDTGILFVSYGDGKLVLTRAGTTHTYDTLELGKNVKLGNIEQSNKDRFKTYIIKGQGLGKDKKTTRDSSEPVGRVVDNVIERYRPIVIFAQGLTTKGICLKRAGWERSNREGTSRMLEYEVQGWTQSNGVVWPLNSLARVKDSFLGIDGTLLIAAVIFSLDDSSGKITKLVMVDPKTFEPQPAEETETVTTKADWRSKARARVK